MKTKLWFCSLLQASIFCCLLFIITFSGKAAEVTAAKPNIVFILADDLGINDLTCYNRTDHRTPHLDRLASQGTRFTCAYNAQPICSPSRAAIMTGKAPARLHLTTYLPGRPDCVSQKVLHPKINQQLPLEEKTLAEYLKEGGYITGCVGKWHLGNKGFSPLDQGFDFYHPGKAVTVPSETEGGKGEYDLTAAAIRFIETTRPGHFSSTWRTTVRTFPTPRKRTWSPKTQKRWNRCMPG